MLAALEIDAPSLRDEFDQGVADTVFLQSLDAQRDVYITYDHRQKIRQAEARAILEAGVTALWLGPFWGKKDFMAQARWLLNKWDKIDSFASSVVQGTCAEIKESGRASVFRL